MANFSNPQMQIFLVQNTLAYEELSTLPTELRGSLGDVVVTKANYNMMHELISSVNRNDNNLLILLTKDLQMSADLQIELGRMNEKGIRLVLYPKALSENNSYLVARTKEDILNAAKMFQNMILGRLTNLGGQVSTSNRNAMMQESASANIRLPEALSPATQAAQQTNAPLSRLLPNQAERPLGFRVHRSRDKQFSSLMHLIYIKYKNNTLIDFREIQSLEGLKGAGNEKQILIVAERQAEEVQRFLPHLDGRVFAVKFMSKRGVKKPNTLFKFETNSLQDVEYLVDSALQTYSSQPHQGASVSQRQNRLVRSNQRIQMKSAKKIYNNLTNSKASSECYVYETNQQPGFRQFYSRIPMNMQLVSSFQNLRLGSSPIVLAPSQQCSGLFAQVPRESRLVLFASTLTPNILINHPMVALVTSSSDEVAAYLKSQNVGMLDNRPLTPVSSSVSHLKQNNVSSNVGSAPMSSKNSGGCMIWNVIFDGANFNTNLNNEYSFQNSKLNGGSGSFQGSELSNLPINEAVQSKKMNASVRQQVMISVPSPADSFQTIKEPIASSYENEEEIVIRPKRKVGSGAQMRDSKAISPKEETASSFRPPSMSAIAQQRNRANALPSYGSQILQWYVYRVGNEFQVSRQNPQSQRKQPFQNQQSKIIFNQSLLGESNIRKPSIPQIVVHPPEIFVPPSQIQQKIHYVSPIRESVISNTPPIQALEEHHWASSTPIQVTQTPLMNKSLKQIGSPVNNTMTFNEYSLHDTRVQHSPFKVNIVQPYFQSVHDISYSLESLPEKIFTEKAISCRLIQTPQKGLERNLLGIRAQPPQASKITFSAPANSFSYHAAQPMPLLVGSQPSQHALKTIYQQPETIYISNYIAKKQAQQSLCSGVLQVRTQKQAPQYSAPPSLDSASFIQRMSGISYQPPLERVSKVIFQSPVTNYSQEINYRTSYLQDQPKRQSQSTQHMLPPRVSQRVSNLSTRAAELPLLNQKRQSGALQLNQLNFEVRTENGVKVYKRKSRSVGQNFQTSNQFLRQLHPSNHINLRADYHSSANPGGRANYTKQQRHSYYNTENISPRLSSIKAQMPSRQSQLTVGSEYLATTASNQRVYRTSRMSGVAGNHIRTNSFIQQTAQKSNPPSLFVNVLCPYQETNLQESLQTRLRNKAHLLKYHDEKSLIERTLESKDQNLVVVLNQQARAMDEQLQDIHPNISIITYSRSKVDGTNVVSTIPQVLSLIQKWYFRY